LHHHEKVNGMGYPNGLQGKDIPEMAKIIAIVDVYDALVSDRPYKTAMPPNMAYQIIMEGFNTHFEGRIVWAFQKFIVPYPVNCLVVLNSGEVAKVAKVNRQSLLRPIIELDGQMIDLTNHPRLSIVNIYRPR
ncbi:MAG TPA: HD domain-containing phosphohydrolase, partial [Chroococcales cyanobacterium]